MKQNKAPALQRMSKAPASRKGRAAPHATVSAPDQARLTPRDLVAQHLLLLQRTAGNAAVNQLLQDGVLPRQQRPTNQQHTGALPTPASGSAIGPQVVQRASDAEIKENTTKLNGYVQSVREAAATKGPDQFTEENKAAYTQLLEQVMNLANVLIADDDYHRAGLLRGLDNLLSEEIGELDAILGKIPPGSPPGVFFSQCLGILRSVRNRTLTRMVPLDVAAVRAALPPALLEVLPQWLERRVGTDRIQQDLLLSRMGPTQVQESLTQFIQNRQAEQAPAGFHDAQQLGTTVESAILSSQTLGRLIGEGYVDGSIRGAITVLDDAAFAQMYLEQALTENPGINPAALRARLAPTIDNIRGLHFNGKVYVRKGETSVHTPIHETIHFLGETRGGGQWKTRLGADLEEAATETITLGVLNELGLPPTTAGYADQIKLLDMVMNDSHISPQDLVSGYLGLTLDAQLAKITNAPADNSDGVALLHHYSGDVKAAYIAWSDAMHRQIVRTNPPQ